MSDLSIPFASESGHCRNGGCTKPIYRGRVCFRCWAGIKWTSIRQRIENKNGNNPSYEGIPLGFTREELILWVMGNPPPETLEVPSIDRIIPELGYVPGNIRWIEKDLNSCGPQRDLMLNGKRMCAKCKQVFPASNSIFVKQSKNKHGLGIYCKPCWRGYTRERAYAAKELA